MGEVIPLWLNDAFVEKALRNEEGDETISVIKTAIAPATAKGDNYLSDMYRVNVEYSRVRGSGRTNEERSIVVKISLTSEGGHKDFIEKSQVFDIEIDMMTSTLREMQELLDDTKLYGKCLYAQYEGPALLVIEDLANLGFRMTNRETGLDLQHSLAALMGLAKFHATSVAVCEKKPELKKKYNNKGQFRMDAPPELAAFFIFGMKSFARVVGTWPEFDQKFADNMMKLSDIGYQKTAFIKQINESEFNVINHGDFWINNMLFRYDEFNQPIGHTFVDFQHCAYASPALDLNYFLNTSPSENVSINHMDDLMKAYHQTLCETMKRINCKTQVPTFSELKNYVRKWEFYGLVTACTVLPLVLIKKSEAQSFEEIMEGDGSNNKAYHTMEYRVAMTRRLLHWRKNGLLDF